MVSHVDTEWLIEEGKLLAAEGTPKRPALIGGSGLCGMNLVVLLASVPGCEEIVVVDARPPFAKVLKDANIDQTRVKFEKHFLGTDTEEDLTKALKGVDCVFSMVTPHVQKATLEDFNKTNIAGVEVMIRACKAANVTRIVHLSSIAASNMYVNSYEQDEKHPLPPIEAYDIPYDHTKRVGEEMVLAASCDCLRTCALRPGGIMLSPNDFAFSNCYMKTMGFEYIPQPPEISQVDFIDGRDVCRALVMSAQSLFKPKQGVSGEAFFCTKGDPVYPSQLAMLSSKHSKIPMVKVPFFVIRLAMAAAFVQHHVRKLLGLRVPGVPPHRFMQQAFSTKTFNNSKIEKAIGFKPKVTLEEACARISKIYLAERELVAAHDAQKRMMVYLVVALTLGTIFRRFRR